MAMSMHPGHDLGMGAASTSSRAWSSAPPSARAPGFEPGRTARCRKKRHRCWQPSLILRNARRPGPRPARGRPPRAVPARGRCRRRQPRSPTRPRAGREGSVLCALRRRDPLARRGRPPGSSEPAARHERAVRGAHPGRRAGSPGDRRLGAGGDRGTCSPRPYPAGSPRGTCEAARLGARLELLAVRLVEPATRASRTRPCAAHADTGSLSWPHAAPMSSPLLQPHRRSEPGVEQDRLEREDPRQRRPTERAPSQSLKGIRLTSAGPRGGAVPGAGRPRVSR